MEVKAAVAERDRRMWHEGMENKSALEKYRRKEEKKFKVYSLESSCGVLSDECQGFRHFSNFLHHFVLANLATSSIRVNPYASGG